MPYTIDTRSRYNLVVYHRLLTGLPVKISFFFMAALASLLWLLLVYFITSGVVLGLAIVTTGAAAGLSLAYIFGTTYFPHLPPPFTAAQIAASQKTADGNIIYAAGHDFLAAVGNFTSTASQHRLQTLVKNLLASPDVRQLLSRLQINEQNLYQALEATYLPQLTVSEFARRIIQVAISRQDNYLLPEHAAAALLLHSGLEASVRSMDLTNQDIRFALWWTISRRKLRRQARQWWRKERLLSITGIGLSWASGYTPFVDRFARLPPGNIWDDTLFGHEGKIDELINTLARQRQSNVLLVGDPGTGRVGLIRELAHRIQHNRAHHELNGERIIYLNVGEIVGQSATGAGQYAGITRALNEIERAGNIITIIDGLSSILGRAGEQQVNLTDVLSPFLSSNQVRVVVMINAEDYHLRLKANQELIHYFEVVMLPSLSLEATKQRVALTVPAIERKSGVFIPYRTVRSIVEDTASILPHIPFPERAFDFLEEAIVLAQNEKARVLTEDHVHAIISRKIGIDLGRLKNDEKDRLLNLGEIMHQRLVNQEQAVQAVTRALIRARAEVRNVKRPIGTFLFLGPTGVGKTETAKTLADAYFGSEDHMIRLDMSEFQGEDAVARLIGSSTQPVGRLTSLISDHPFTVLLLDEFEKASSQVHQLFLQVFDEGRLTDASGRQYSFLHSIIIATSNAGAEKIRQTIKGGNVPAGFADDLKEYILSQNLLRPELLNRFDDVVIYTPLTKDHIREIARLMLGQLNQRLDAQHGVTVEVTADLIEKLVAIGYDPEFGARPMSRAIQDTIEFAVAQMVIKGETQPGHKITISPAIFTR